VFRGKNNRPDGVEIRGESLGGLSINGGFSTRFAQAQTKGSNMPFILNFSGNKGLFMTPLNLIGHPVGAKGLQGSKGTNSLNQIGLSLAIVSVENHKAGGSVQRHLFEVAKMP
jgi:hypothetical protein